MALRSTLHCVSWRNLKPHLGTNLLNIFFPIGIHIQNYYLLVCLVQLLLQYKFNSFTLYPAEKLVLRHSFPTLSSQLSRNCVVSDGTLHCTFSYSKEMKIIIIQQESNPQLLLLFRHCVPTLLQPNNILEKLIKIYKL